MFDAGMRVQPSSPASARLAPRNLRKPRRSTPSAAPPIGEYAPSRRAISSRSTLTSDSSSPVACRARGQLSQVIPRDEGAARILVAAHPAWHARVSGTNVSLGRTVAFEAPLHREGRRLIDLLHQMNGTVTGFASDARAHVRGMVEENE